VIRLRPYTEKEFGEIEKKGFSKFFWGYSFESLFVFYLVFSVINFVIYFEQQTDLMKTGVMSSIVLAPASSLFIWLVLKNKFRKSGSTS